MKKRLNRFIAILLSLSLTACSTVTEDNSEKLLDKAEEAFEEKEYEDAIDYYEEYLEENDGSFSDWLNLAECYIEIGETDEAIDVLEDGYEKTDSKKLFDMLEELRGEEKPAEETTTVNENLFEGLLAEPAITPEEAREMLIKYWEDDIEPDMNRLKTVTELDLSDLDLLIKDISILSELTNLTSLELSSGIFTDISPLSGLTNLTSLSLGECSNLTDISSLSRLTNLTSLNLYFCTDLTDISPLSELTNLTSLGLQWCSNLTDISPLSELTNLTSLSLQLCSNLTDISPLSGLTKLTYLDLGFCNITDISPLSGLTNLTSLSLSGCYSITDISALSELTNLTILYLYGCDRIVLFSNLKRILPKCKIEY